MTRTLRPLVIIALLALAGILAMHGISGHGHSSSTGSESAAATNASAFEGHDPGAHGRDSNEPCRTCTPSNAAGLCAFMVLAAVAVGSRPTNALRARLPLARQPKLPSWTPEPPVPRFVLVPAM